MTETIPFNKPYMAGKELYYIAQSVLSGHTSGDGEFSKNVSTYLNKHFMQKDITDHFMHFCSGNDGTAL